MKMKTSIRAVFLLMVFLVNSTALAFHPLNDDQLDLITAGAAGSEFQDIDSLARIPLRYTSNKVDVDGDIIVLPASSYDQNSRLQLLDNAQSNLKSLININAVNSPVNVLLNLNINVQSTIDRVIQLNTLSAD
jgi:hypothetical protein